MPKLHLINTANIRLSRWFFYEKPGWHLIPPAFAPFQPKRNYILCPCPAFLIQHAGRNILVDTGLSPAWVHDPAAYFPRYLGPTGRLVARLIATLPTRPLIADLASALVAPDQVD